MKHPTTAIILMGCQNDYFTENGRFDVALEPWPQRRKVLDHIVEFVECVRDRDVLILNLPMTVDDRIAASMMGTPLEPIARSHGLRPDSQGAAVVDDLKVFGDRMINVPGKHKVNAFRDTALEVVLREHGIIDTILAGAVTSFSIDATGRAAYERGYRVTILEDGTIARSAREQNFYLTRIFPTYAQTVSRQRLIDPSPYGAGLPLRQ